MGRLGHERALFVHRSQACRLDEFCKLQGRDARAVPFRRSLGDTAGGRTAVFGIYLDRAGNPEHHARGRRREQDRTFWFLSPRTSRHPLARRGGVARGDGGEWVRRAPPRSGERRDHVVDSILKEPLPRLLRHCRARPTSVRHGSCLKRRTALILLVSSWLRIIWTRKGINAVRHQNIVFHGLLKHIPWSSLDRLVDQYEADWDGRAVKTKAHLIAMLYAQFCGARSLREIETSLKSHTGQLYHLGGC